MSHIQKTPQGTYKVRWMDPATGHERSKTFERRRDANRFKISTDNAIQEDTYVDPRGGRTPLGEYANAWIESRTMGEARSRIADNAVRRHIVPRIGELRLGQIRMEKIQEWVDDLARDLAPGSVRNIYEVLAQILNSSVEDRLIARSPLTRRLDGKKVMLPDGSRELERCLTSEEVEALICAAPPDVKVLVQFLASTGLRIGEALGLRVKSIDAARQLVVVERQRLQNGGFGPTKTKTARSVPIPSRTVTALLPAIELRGGEADLWLSDLGEPLQYRAFRYRWKKTLDEASLNWEPTAHDLRHYYASKLIRAGLDIVRVSKFLGHSNVTKTLDVYAHVMGHDVEDLEAAFGDLPLGSDGL